MDGEFDFLLLPWNELLDRRLSGERSGRWRPAPATRENRGDGSQHNTPVDTHAVFPSVAPSPKETV
jgi:hypothetical protein